MATAGARPTSDRMAEIQANVDSIRADIARVAKDAKKVCMAIAKCCALRFL